MTVLDNIMLGRHVRMKSSWFAGAIFLGKAQREELENRERVEEIIDLLEIEEWRKYPVALLPYGIQKRVELGRALAMDPELPLLDEPVVGMNLEETEDMARFILDIREELGIAIVLVEHDMGLVMDIADRIMVLDFGRKIAEVQANPEVIKAYLGEEV
jgi:branched-chain amino acid transport system ATP-binding protein